MATIHDSTFTKVAILSRRVSQVYNDALRPFKITASQYVLLRELSETHGRASEISDRLCIEKSGLSRNLRLLEKLGAISRDRPAGRRGRAVVLTEKGTRLLEVCARPWRDAELSVGENVDNLLMKVGFLAAAE